jgi:hypothetical protein
MDSPLNPWSNLCGCYPLRITRGECHVRKPNKTAWRQYLVTPTTSGKACLCPHILPSFQSLNPELAG